MIQITKLNNTKLQVICEDDVALELNSYFTEFAEGYLHHPLFKQRRWDGKIRFFNGRSRTINVGFLGDIYKFAASRNYPIAISDDVKWSFSNNYSREEFVSNIRAFPITAYGEPVEFRDYQLLGIYDAIKTKRKMFSANTSSGKSLIQYGIIRLLQDKVEGKILLIVPSTALVEQMYTDFRDYAELDENWRVENECARLYADYKYDNRKDILISTWQSLQTKDNEFLEQFSAVLCDEAHQAKAKVISSIMEKCTNAEYRLAFTGTVPKERVNLLTIVGHFGPVKVLSTSKEAMEKGYISQLKINCLALQYDEVISKKIKKMKYQDEIEALCGIYQRNLFIVNLAKKLKGNTLILTARVDSHGKVLVDMLNNDNGGKTIYGIFGEVKTAVREEIRAIMESSTNNITVGNFQIVSTGWSVRNLDNIIFAFPSKSFTRVVQSIGRGLRKNEGKEHCELYDIADSFDDANYSWEHFIERTKIYDEEGFNYSIREIPINTQPATIIM